MKLKKVLKKIFSCQIIALIALVTEARMPIKAVEAVNVESSASVQTQVDTINSEVEFTGIEPNLVNRRIEPKAQSYQSQFDDYLNTNQNSVAELAQNYPSSQIIQRLPANLPLVQQLEETISQPQPAVANFPLVQQLESTKSQPQLDENFRQRSNSVVESTQENASLENFPLVSDLFQDAQPKKPDENSDYKIPLQIVPNNKVPTLLTNLNLNGATINHLTRWQGQAGYTFGAYRGNNFDINSIYRINSQVRQSLSSDNIFTSEQTGRYIQFQTVQQNQEITVTKKDPQTMMGFQTQITFTGTCPPISEGLNPDSQCVLTPSLVVDKASIDSHLFIPTRINQSVSFGTPVSPETLAILAQPGFQNVGANGELIGIDLYFPNAGAVPGNTQSTQSSVFRKEVNTTTPALGLYSIRQIIKANHAEAVIGRTIRGINIIVGDPNTALNTALQLGTAFLPDAEPKIQGSTEAVNTNINQNLFFAANNTWIPGNSFTIYQAGLGQAAHSTRTHTGQISTPTAHFNSLWIGLSPVIERSESREIFYELTGSQRVIASGGGEGGGDSNVDFTSVIDDQRISSFNFKSFYTQVYFSFFNQDVNYVTVEKLKETTSYYPNFSLSGNLTDTNQVFRYYAGVLASEQPKLYLGLDYTKLGNGWVFNIGGLAYTNPDRDYFSYIGGEISKTIPINSSSNVIFSSGFKYAFDQGNDSVLNSSLNLEIRANLGDFSLGLTQYLGDIIPLSVNSLLGIDVSVKLSEQLRLTAYLSPFNQNSSQLRYGVTTQYRLGKDYNSPSILLTWKNEAFNYNYGCEEFKNTSNTFILFFKSRPF